jgi:DNA alkylation damage repair protein AlkB
VAPEFIAPGAALLRGFACDVAEALVQAAEQVIAAAPLRHLVTPGARLSLHQDQDEGDMTAPIVSVPLDLPAIFLFGTNRRSEHPARYRLLHGDVAVWGGPSRLAYHCVAPLADGNHIRLGRRRINLTFRCAGQKH